VDANRSLEKEIVENLFPESDQVVKDAGRFFYGSPDDADFSLNLDGIDYPMIDGDIWDSSQQNAGYKSIQWNATNNAGQPVSAGLYLYTIQADEFRQVKKMVLLK
jgi:hypothetical protein